MQSMLIVSASSSMFFKVTLILVLQSGAARHKSSATRKDGLMMLELSKWLTILCSSDTDLID